MEGSRSYIRDQKYVGVLASFSPFFPSMVIIEADMNVRSIDEEEFNNTGFMSVSLAFENCYSESITGVETAPVQSGTLMLQSPKSYKHKFPISVMSCKNKIRLISALRYSFQTQKTVGRIKINRVID